MFMAAAFGMMALLSLPLTVPDLNALVPRVVLPPVVHVPAGPEEGPSAASRSRGHPELSLSAAAASPAIPLAQRGPTGAPPQQGPGSPPPEHRGGHHSFQRRLERKILRKASRRIKALVRHGKLDADHVLARASSRFLHRQGPVPWGHQAGHGHGSAGHDGGSGGGDASGHGHSCGHGHGSGHGVSHGSGHGSAHGSGRGSHAHAWHGAK
jgi:hypothetical protein